MKYKIDLNKMTKSIESGDPLRALEFIGLFKKKDKQKDKQTSQFTQTISEEEFDKLKNFFNSKYKQMIAIAFNVHKTYYTEVYNKIFDKELSKKNNLSLEKFLKLNNPVFTKESEFMTILNNIAHGTEDKTNSELKSIANGMDYNKYSLSIPIFSAPDSDMINNNTVTSLTNEEFNSLLWETDENGKVIGRQENFYVLDDVIDGTSIGTLELSSSNGSHIADQYRSGLMEKFSYKLANTLNQKYGSDLNKYGAFKFQMWTDGEISYGTTGFIINFNIGN